MLCSLSLKSVVTLTACQHWSVYVAGIVDMQKQLYALNMLILVLPEVNRNVLLVSLSVVSFLTVKLTASFLSVR